MQVAPDISVLYPEFSARIYRYLRRLAEDELVAEDLTQETFLRAVERLHTFRGEGQVSNWLYRIATNLYWDHLRKHTGRWEEQNDTAAGEESFSQVPDPTPPLPDLLAHQEVTACVHDCIASLPAPYRATLLLYAVEGKTVEECATILGCSKAAIKVRLHRGRRMFKELAAERCDVSAERGGGVSCLPKQSGKL